ncbi:MAG: hypothetical protein LBH54_05725 [Clostridiales bacterium]|jgi:hypothetical protein|nr:hypothetical protein [Clostridiales bacterium]
MNRNEIAITDKFCGGNIKILSLSANEARLTPDLRDGGDWFYWAFCVKNAHGKTIKFDFDGKCCVGYWGPAVSYDLKEWRWLGGSDGADGFTYTFSGEEREVYFAHHMLYHPARFAAFAAANALEVKSLCLSEKERTVPYVTFGGGGREIILTARHHACESTGNYVLEGVLAALSQRLPKDYSVFCVPFADYDGVIDGDQGKGRNPHDHNRDYTPNAPSIYKSVDAIRRRALARDTAFGFDFHAPGHCGGRDDKVFVVQNNFQKVDALNRFGHLFEQHITKAAFAYSAKNDCPPGFDWNQPDLPTFSAFMNALPRNEIAATVETAYFGEAGNVFSPDAAVETGRCFAAALVDYIARFCR